VYAVLSAACVVIAEACSRCGALVIRGHERNAVVARVARPATLRPSARCEFCPHVKCMEENAGTEAVIF